MSGDKRETVAPASLESGVHRDALGWIAGSTWWKGVLIGLAVLVGVWLRAALALRSGLWRDEVQSLAIAQLPSAAEMLHFLGTQESHPPLFYFIERYWVQLVGTSDLAIVALGLIPGAFVVPASALVAWLAAGSSAAVLASWTTALAWPLVWQSGDARPYALLGLVALATSAAARSASTRDSRAAVRVYVAGCLILLFLHNWSVLIVGTLATMSLIAAWKQSPDRVAKWVIAHGVIAACYVWWIPLLLRQRAVAGYPRHGPFPVEWLLVAPAMLLGVTLVLLVPAAAVLIAGARSNALSLRAKAWARWFALAALLPCFAALSVWRVSGLTIAHCAAILTPTALVAAACVIAGGSRRSGRATYLYSTGLVAIIGAALVSHWMPKSNMREVAAFLSKSATAGDLVVLYPASTAPAFARYAESGLRVVTYPAQASGSPVGFAGWWTRFSAPIEESEALGALDSTMSSDGRVWLVIQHIQRSEWDAGVEPGPAGEFRAGISGRLTDLRRELRRRSGEPPIQIAPGMRAWARERIVIERYSPPKGAPSRFASGQATRP